MSRIAPRVVLALLLLAGLNVARAAEVHGASDAFATPGIALAWAMLRGADDASTRVLLRMEVDPAYADVAVVGIDPFTRAATPLLEHGRGLIVVAAARSHFAQFPRTEIRLSRTPGGAPEVVVYYVSVPDTTPEFDDASKLDAYLDERLARLRATAPRRMP